jgi:hypothetical protein
MRPTVTVLALFGALAVGYASRRASNGADRWVRVAHDSNYDIAIDTAQIGGDEWRGYRIVYRTDHATTHNHNGLPFNREVVEAVLSCHNLSFRVASVDMSLGDGAPVARQRTEPGELGNQPWRRVEPGTIEETAARAACDIARRRRR